MSKHMEFYIHDDASSMQIGKNVYRHVAIPIDDFNAACDHYGFVKERTCEVDGSYSCDGWLDESSHIWTFELSCGHSIDSLWGEPPRYCPECGARVTPKNSETTPKVVS